MENKMNKQKLKKLAVLAGLCVSLGFHGCAEESKPTNFSMREPIPLGDATLTVSYLEETTQFSPFFQKTSGYSQVVVFLTCKGFNLEKEDLKSMKNSLTLFSLSLAVAGDKQFRLATIIPETAYRMAQSQLSGDQESVLSEIERSTGRPPEDWVAIFQVPEQSRCYTLLIKNPSIQKGQPQVAAVSLGR
jgi:hypothetical protein